MTSMFCSEVFQTLITGVLISDCLLAYTLINEGVGAFVASWRFLCAVEKLSLDEKHEFPGGVILPVVFFIYFFFV